MNTNEFREGLAKIGWKQTDFASWAGVTPVAVSNWLTGDAPLPLWAQRTLELLLKLHDLNNEVFAPPTRAARLARRLAKKESSLFHDN
ncbi:conserved hypothetical protein [Nitrosomonas nitrosa]|jgi:predicted transcriptional regulator|uniref:Uncharacterized protein n=1 Tax=Nitrosomonas nitrosa TaxID=52442 RepID=A0A8H9DB08_9PROT|nr:helix-turn-helix domain-containing protein [Nitrosomonas nitrosa]CAE6511686.1 conserved hypothetical protein [Nitrosomonas nitrosa]